MFVYLKELIFYVFIRSIEKLRAINKDGNIRFTFLLLNMDFYGVFRNLKRSFVVIFHGARNFSHFFSTGEIIKISPPALYSKRR